MITLVIRLKHSQRLQLNTYTYVRQRRARAHTHTHTHTHTHIVKQSLSSLSLLLLLLHAPRFQDMFELFWIRTWRPDTNYTHPLLLCRCHPHKTEEWWQDYSAVPGFIATVITPPQQDPLPFLPDRQTVSDNYERCFDGQSADSYRQWQSSLGNVRGHFRLTNRYWLLFSSLLPPPRQPPCSKACQRQLSLRKKCFCGRFWNCLSWLNNSNNEHTDFESTYFTWGKSDFIYIY